MLSNQTCSALSLYDVMHIVLICFAVSIIKIACTIVLVRVKQNKSDERVFANV